MKKQLIYLSVGLFSILLSSCKPSTESTSDNETSEETFVEVDSQEEKQIACNLSTMSFSIGNNTRRVQFNYEGDFLTSAVTTIEGMPQTLGVNYTYSRGKLASFKFDKGAAIYNYDSKGRLEKIEGIQSVNTRVFTYDELGRIIEQTTLVGARAIATHRYGYDGDMLRTVTVLDANGEETEVNELSYDDKKNPFIGKGAMINITEILLGYPAANTINNITLIKKTYKKDTAYKVRGKQRKEGEVDERPVTYEYNEHGYPIKISSGQGENQDTIDLTYVCN